MCAYVMSRSRSPVAGLMIPRLVLCDRWSLTRVGQTIITTICATRHHQSGSTMWSEWERLGRTLSTGRARRLCCGEHWSPDGNRLQCAVVLNLVLHTYKFIMMRDRWPSLQIGSQQLQSAFTRTYGTGPQLIRTVCDCEFCSNQTVTARWIQSVGRSLMSRIYRLSLHSNFKQYSTLFSLDLYLSLSNQYQLFFLFFLLSYILIILMNV